MGERKDTLVLERADELWRPGTRREFLRLLGIGGTVVMLPSVFAACDDDDDPTGTGGTNQPVSLNLSNDFGILNYAYALEQLEAAFYTAVLASAVFNGLSAEEKEVLTDLRDHEVIHREYFKAALGSTNRIRDLALNTATVAPLVASRDAILKNAEMFEDLGVAAYNGAGKYLTSADFLTMAGKIVSVEARHAATIRDMRDALGILGGDADNTRFAGDTVVKPLGDTYQGLDVKLEPAVVVAAVGALNLLQASSAVTIGTQPATKTGTPNFAPPSPTP
jgi:rubrerythrin